MQFSIDEIKKNPLFGTGDVFFTHEYEGMDGTIEAPAHNVILQTMNCYGLIGVLMVVGTLIAIVFRSKFLSLKKHFLYPLSGLLVIVVFLGISLIQATAYDILVLPVMISCVSTFAVLNKEAYIK